nr:sal-like protein 3 [Pongo pygmaeus]
MQMSVGWQAGVTELGELSPEIPEHTAAAEEQLRVRMPSCFSPSLCVIMSTGITIIFPNKYCSDFSRRQGDLRWAPPAAAAPSTAGAGDAAEHQVTPGQFLQGARKQAVGWLCRDPRVASGPTQAGPPRDSSCSRSAAPGPSGTAAAAALAQPGARQSWPSQLPPLNPSRELRLSAGAPVDPAGSDSGFLSQPAPAPAPPTPQQLLRTPSLAVPSADRPPPLPPASRVAPLRNLFGVCASALGPGPLLSSPPSLPSLLLPQPSWQRLPRLLVGIAPKPVSPVAVPLAKHCKGQRPTCRCGRPGHRTCPGAGQALSPQVPGLGSLEEPRE